MSNNQKKTETLDQIAEALNAYENNSVDLINRAFEEKGAAGVKALEGEYQALQHAYYDLLNRQLITNSASYPDLMNQTIAATNEIKDSIAGLEKVGNVFKAMKQTVDLVGRVLVLFGI